MAYDKGDLVRLSAKFQDPASGDAYVDPATVTLKVKKPDTTTTTYTYPANIAKDSTGHYHYDLDVGTANGLWYYRWETTGTYQAAEEATFTVNASAF